MRGEDRGEDEYQRKIEKGSKEREERKQKDKSGPSLSISLAALSWQTTLR